MVRRRVRGTAESAGARVIEPAGLAYCPSAALAVVAAASLLYNSLMFVFATAANQLFPLYLAMLALAAWSAAAVLRQVDVAAFGAPFSRQTRVRGIAVCMWAIVALNAATWLVRIIPAAAAAGPPAGYLAGLLLVAWIAVQLLILQRHFFRSLPWQTRG